MSCGPRRGLARVVIGAVVVLVAASGCSNSVTGTADTSGIAAPGGSTVQSTARSAPSDSISSTPTVGSSITATTPDPGSSTGSPDSSAGSQTAGSQTSGSQTSGSQTSGSQSSSASTTASAPPVAEVTSSPAVNSTGISPTDPISVSVAQGTITSLALTNAAGYQVKGTFSGGRTSWKTDEVLGYGKLYTLTGVATGTDGKTVALASTYTVVKPQTEVRTTIYPTDGMTVGVAMPVMVKFAVKPQDMALIEKNVSITTTPKVDGAWGWIAHDGGIWGLDFRPKGYWPENTKVHVEAKVYGLKFADGSYGATDLSSDFTIGRNQVVKADVTSHQLIVQHDGTTVASYPASYGQGNSNPDLTTRSGIHVVNFMKPAVRMSNPKYHYTNLLERWAVRISNNGEFIHANPASVNAQGTSNVTHGCVNLSLQNAEKYYRTAMLGDPVEITGTDIQLGPSDGDIFDYAIPWDTWLTLSALN